MGLDIWLKALRMVHVLVAGSNTCSKAIQNNIGKATLDEEFKVTGYSEESFKVKA
jgi:hypothetical protein